MPSWRLLSWPWPWPWPWPSAALSLSLALSLAPSRFSALQDRVPLALLASLTALVGFLLGRRSSSGSSSSRLFGSSPSSSARVVASPRNRRPSASAEEQAATSGPRRRRRRQMGFKRRQYIWGAHAETAYDGKTRGAGKGQVLSLDRFFYLAARAGEVAGASGMRNQAASDHSDPSEPSARTFKIDREPMGSLQQSKILSQHRATAPSLYSDGLGSGAREATGFGADDLSDFLVSKAIVHCLREPRSVVLFSVFSISVPPCSRPFTEPCLGALVLRCCVSSACLCRAFVSRLSLPLRPLKETRRWASSRWAEAAPRSAGSAGQQAWAPVSAQSSESSGRLLIQCFKCFRSGRSPPVVC